MTDISIEQLDLLCRQAHIGKPIRQHFLASGASNDVFLVETEKATVVLKATRTAAPRRLGNEHQILTTIQDRIGPRIFGFGNTNSQYHSDFIIEEYLIGTHPYQLSETEARQLGRTLYRMHTHPTTAFAEKLDAPTWQHYIASRLQSQLALSRPVAPAPLQKELEAMAQTATQIGASLHKQLEKRTRCLVHTDIIPLNVIFTPQNEMFLIDWEWARLDIPEWDLCSILKAFQFSEKSLEKFWTAYQLPHDPALLQFTTFLQYLNIVAWRTCAFYVRHEYQNQHSSFLGDLEKELAQLRKMQQA